MDGDCYRESCYQCNYANLNRVADITVGDFWGILNCHPDFYSSKGVSSVFINTDKGKKLFERMKSYADVISATLEEGKIKQGNLVSPTKRTVARDSFYIDIDQDDFFDKLSVGLQIKERVKSVIPVSLIKTIKAKIKH